MRLRSLLILAIVCVLVASAVSGAQDRAAEEQLARDFKVLAAIFDPPDVPGIQGKTWKVVDVGPSNWKQKEEGWVLEESPQLIVLRQLNGDVIRLGKPMVGANRPRLKMEAGGGFLGSTIQEADYSIAWAVRNGDYLAMSKEFLAAGIPEEQDEKALFGSLNNRSGLNGHILSAARYAYYAWQLKQSEHATELAALSQRGFQKYRQSYLFGLEEQTWIKFVAEQTARGLRNRAVHDAHEGKDRQALLGMWVRLAAIPDQPYRDEAHDMVAQYRRLIEEDKRWREPDSDQIAKMTVEQKVEYWLYHLRDLDVGQSSDPGNCRVFSGEFAFLNPRRSKDELAHPAEELRKLGVAAVPQLIAHLGDARPTRCKEHWRSYWPDGHHLLRYGDCCQQILDGITNGQMFGNATRREYPIAEGAVQRAKEKFAAWQEANRPSEGNRDK